jgi:hypothetical protein
MLLPLAGRVIDSLVECGFYVEQREGLEPFFRLGHALSPSKEFRFDVPYGGVAAG